VYLIFAWDEGESQSPNKVKDTAARDQSQRWRPPRPSCINADLLPKINARTRAMSKRRVNDAATAEMEWEVRSMKVKTMMSELESLCVSLLGMVKKDDLIDALLRAWRDTGHQVVPSSSSQMSASLRDFA